MADTTGKDGSMSITDELRKWLKSLYTPNSGTVKDEGERIADRIDARHDQMVDFCERLERAVTNSEDVTLWGVDYTALPLDADGVPIHIGDRVENGERVARIVLTDGSWEPSVYIEMLPNVLNEHFCHEIGHYHAPTVEDVLREFADEMNQNLGMYTGEAIDADEWRSADNKIIAEYAAKLRLAGDGE